MSNWECKNNLSQEYYPSWNPASLPGLTLYSCKSAIRFDFIFFLIAKNVQEHSFNSYLNVVPFSYLYVKQDRIRISDFFGDKRRWSVAIRGGVRTALAGRMRFFCFPSIYPILFRYERLKILVRLLILSQCVIIWALSWTVGRPTSVGPALFRALPHTCCLCYFLQYLWALWMILINRRTSQEWWGRSFLFKMCLKLCFKADNSVQIFVCTHIFK